MAEHSIAPAQLPSMDFGPDIPFVRHLGFTLHRMDSGHSELRYEARPEHLNSFAVTHGGATMALLDVAMAVAMAVAARSDTPQLGAVTIEMKVQGFIVSEYMDLGGLVASGKLRPRESVMQGLASAPEAFLGLLKGKNFGKQLVKLV